MLVAARVIALVPLHHWGKTKGNCLIIPKQHVENLYALDPGLGVDLIRATQRLAMAMKGAFGCAGISTRQHNEPAGNQDVWHFHLHVFPRFPDDDLYGAPKLPYDQMERRALAARLRLALPIE